MLQRVARIETTVTRSKPSAAARNNLIKSLLPRYNVLFRDDKSYPYLSQRPCVPRIAYYRGVIDRRARYFGPFPKPGGQETISSCRSFSPAHLRGQCSATLASLPVASIGPVQRPCVGLISGEHYGQDVERAVRFLNGAGGDVG